VGGVWLIVVNSADHPTRQRFTLMHEFKHVLDHHDGKRLYTGRPWLSGHERAADAAKQRERAADFFAGCVLMPKSRMLHLWANGVRKPEDFATHFDVSPAAARVRLEQVGLTRPSWMCTRGLRAPVDGEVRPAFDRAVQEAVEKMRTLGLRAPGTVRGGGRPSMHRTSGSRTLHHPSTTRRFA
jgi:Zn-dependent peptidase ImmA (M78 family)